MKDLKTRAELVEYLAYQLREIGFSMDLDSDVFKRYYFGDKISSMIGYSNKYCVTIQKSDGRVIKDTYVIELVENKPIREKNTNVIRAISGEKLQYFSLSPVMLGNTIEDDIERINNFLIYIYNIDKVKQSLRKKKLKVINGRLGIKI